jgi:hypothetical protein
MNKYYRRASVLRSKRRKFKNALKKKYPRLTKNVIEENIDAIKQGCALTLSLSFLRLNKRFKQSCNHLIFQENASGSDTSERISQSPIFNLGTGGEGTE